MLQLATDYPALYLALNSEDNCPKISLLLFIVLENSGKFSIAYTTSKGVYRGFFLG
jgi:hypothetical protein